MPAFQNRTYRTDLSESSDGRNIAIIEMDALDVKVLGSALLEAARSGDPAVKSTTLIMLKYFSELYEELGGDEEVVRTNESIREQLKNIPLFPETGDFK